MPPDQSAIEVPSSRTSRAPGMLDAISTARSRGTHVIPRRCSTRVRTRTDGRRWVTSIGKASRTSAGTISGLSDARISVAS